MPTPCQGRSCLTRPSGFHEMLLPADTTAHSGGNLRLNNDWDTHVIGVVALKDAYVQAMQEHGWVYLAADSTSDPRKAGGFIFSELFCERGPAPVQVASIIVGGLSDSDPDAATAPRAQIIFSDLSPEGTCP